MSSHHSYSQISSLTHNKSENSINDSSTHKSLKTGHSSSPSILSPHRSTLSSSLITLQRPSITSGLKTSNRSFKHFVQSYGTVFLLTYVMLLNVPHFHLLLSLAFLTKAHLDFTSIIHAFFQLVLFSKCLKITYH